MIHSFITLLYIRQIKIVFLVAVVTILATSVVTGYSIEDLNTRYVTRHEIGL